VKTPVHEMNGRLAVQQRHKCRV